LGLRPGTELLLQVEGEKLVLKPDAGRKGGIEKREGVLVLNGDFYGMTRNIRDVYQEKNFRAFSS